MPNLNLVIDSSFRPYSFEERVKPYLLYKEAYDKAEAEKNTLMDKAGMFKYLADATADDEPAKAIYEGYARDLEAQAADFSKNGLTMNNRRALSDLRSRYAGEIGQLEQADKLLKAEQALRDNARAKGQQMLYANNDLRISNYLGNNKPNTYGIDAEDLRKEGELYAKNVSSGVYSDPEIDRINKNYLQFVTTNGYSPEVMQAWRNDLESLPVFNRAVEDVLKARGATDNLTGADYERARQSVINGIMEGTIYKQNRETKQDLNTLTADQAADDARNRDRLALDRERFNLEKDKFKIQEQEWKDERAAKYIYDKDEDGNVKVDENGYPVIKGINPAYASNKDKTPEQKAIEEQQKADYKTYLQNVEALKKAKTMEDIDKADFVPVFVTVRPSHGSKAGLSVEDARNKGDFSNVEGWRSGAQGDDVPGLYIDWTDAPLIEGSQSLLPDLFQWSSGTRTKPNNGDYSYNLGDAQTKILSDAEVENLPLAVRVSIAGQFKAQNYEEIPHYQIMQVTTEKGKTSYMVLVPKGEQKLN